MTAPDSIDDLLAEIRRTIGDNRTFIDRLKHDEELGSDEEPDAAEEGPEGEFEEL